MLYKCPSFCYEDNIHAWMSFKLRRAPFLWDIAKKIPVNSSISVNHSAFSLTAASKTSC